MDRDQTLSLLQAGEDAWRAWAQNLQERRRELETSNKWSAEADGRGRNHETRQWHEDASAEFSTSGSPHTFSDDVDVCGWVFPGATNFEGAVFCGSARFARCTFLTFANFRRAKFDGKFDCDDAAFSGVHPSVDDNLEGSNRVPNAGFSRNVDFSRAEFFRVASFRKTKFDRTVWFNNSVFHEDARFRQTKFLGDAPFDNAEFKELAWFREASFANEAWFQAAKIKGPADFTQASFAGGANFDHAHFARSALFRAAQCSGAFSFDSTRFERVPDFVQAHFSEAPRLDDIQIGHSWGEPDLASRYRALKRLAIQGHDHGREHEFFVGELKSLRGFPDRLGPNLLNVLRVSVDGTARWKWGSVQQGQRLERLSLWPGGLPGTLRYWFGLWYQWLSNFGRSLALPVFWWIASTILFAVIYLAVHLTYASPAIGRLDAARSAVGILVKKLGFPLVGTALAAPGVSLKPKCVAGRGETVMPALLLSLRRSFVFVGSEFSEKIHQNYACLFGTLQPGGAEGVLLERFAPVIPNSIIIIGVVQLLLSGLLIFLFLLAMRNHFRIK